MAANRPVTLGTCNCAVVVVVVAAAAAAAAVVVVVVVVTFFNHNFVNCKATLIFPIKIYEIKYNISLHDIHT